MLHEFFFIYKCFFNEIFQLGTIELFLYRKKNINYLKKCFLSVNSNQLFLGVRLVIGRDIKWVNSSCIDCSHNQCKFYVIFGSKNFKF